jgi:hypothetical protein
MKSGIAPELHTSIDATTNVRASDPLSSLQGPLLAPERDRSPMYPALDRAVYKKDSPGLCHFAPSHLT